MSTVKSLYERTQHEKWLLEVSGDPNILELESKCIKIFEELAEALEGTEHYLIELGTGEPDAKLTGKLDDGKLKRLFQAAAAISRGQPEQASMLQDFKVRRILKRFKTIIKDAGADLFDKAPVEHYKWIMSNADTKYKKILGKDHEALKIYKELYRFGEENIRKQQLIINTTSILSGQTGKPFFKAIAAPVLKQILDIAKEV
jgi:hypothetical protein